MAHVLDNSRQRITFFAWSAGTMWLAVSAVLAIFYFSLRTKPLFVQDPTIALLTLAVDVGLFILLGRWLLRGARGWFEARMSLIQVLQRLVLRALFLNCILGVVLTTLWWLRADAPSLAGFRAAFSSYLHTAPMLDQLFFWMVAASVVPLPWITSERQSAESPAATAPEILLVRINGRTEAVRISKIGHAVAADNYIELHCDSNVYLHRMTLTAFVTAFASRGFVRVGRGAAVNLAKVQSLDASTSGELWLVLDNGTQVPIARRWRAKVRSALADHSPQP